MIDRPIRNYLLRLYEIEHGGDLDCALDALCAMPEVREVTAISVDYEGRESADIRLSTIGVDKKELRALLERAEVISDL